MKNSRTTVLVVLFSIILVILTLCSCSTGKNRSGLSEPTDTAQNPVTTDAEKYIIQCILNPLSEEKLAEKDNYTMFSDESYFYYIIKIGQMQFIPVSIDQLYYYDGTSVKELEFTASSIDVNSVKSTIQTQVESHTEWSSTFSIPNVEYADLSLGSILTDYQYGSSDYFEMNELEELNGTANISSTVLREKFDSSRPAGNWAYVFFANVDVYASIITDKDHNIVDISTQNKIINGNYDFQFLGDSKIIPDYSKGDNFKVDLESNTIKSIIMQTPVTDISGK
jgi:hypothetical protein